MRIYIYKSWRTNFLWVLNFVQVGGPDTRIQKHPSGWIFKNLTKSEKNTKDFPVKYPRSNLKGILYVFRRSNQFIEDISCKFEGDFNILLNFFFGRNFF